MFSRRQATSEREKKNYFFKLEFAVEDFCVAQVAKGLGKQKNYEFFMKRSKNYKNLFDTSTGFMTPRLSDVTFYRGDPAKYRAFTEGSPWTYLFCVM
ncbi:MAG: glycoside hydrolase family 92 protein [Bacteroidota bacterium]|nr:glycoside hydrolase family 92 protein [Bacteroidota bacterium]